ncbi:tyrosine-type recombinase/integrase [Marinovum sp.]|uniref:tyrosine-type recombinase/integrase n=1 Tax=Marinovum sp. TaxID=2024839 RepID=UPI002B268861|nr:tyrosine-type recombinase/integrase [Marinovum sp.]
MAHKMRYIVQRGCSYYYNRRVPDRVADAFGAKVVRVNFGRDPSRAANLGEALSTKLDEVWAADRVMPVDVARLVQSFERLSLDLLTCADDYLSGKNIAEQPVRLAVGALVEVAGNRAIETYQRVDARQVVAYLLEKGNKTATVRRRIQSLHAVLEYGFLEQDLEKRNPFARLTIKGENSDTKKRGVFTDAQLAELYGTCLASERDTRLILPILGETGARLAEVVGLRWSDVNQQEGVVSFVPHELRRLKTRGSERSVPLVGAAKSAIDLLSKMKPDDEFIFSRWVKPSGVVATHASNTLNKYIRSRYGDLTCHCFRHTLRDRLRNSGCSPELVDQIGGWTSRLGVGAGYGHGYNLDRQREALEQVVIRL